MTELTTAELWQSAPAEAELSRLRKSREAIAHKHWHTPAKGTVLSLVQVAQAVVKEPK